MMDRVTRSSTYLATVAFAVALLYLGNPALVAQTPPAGGTDARTKILALHKQIDDDYAKAVMSPFSATSVQYFEAGQTHRLGFGAAGVVFDPDMVMTDVVELSFTDDVFWITPVSGPHAPAVMKTQGDGASTATPGAPITGKMKLSPRDVIGVDRFLVQFVIQQGLGNARVFDPEAPARKTFTGLKWFEPNLALQVKAVFVPNPAPDKVIIGTSRGLSKEFYRVGVFEFQVDGKPQKLTALTGSKVPRVGDEFFVPFRDATTGVESYSVGRYLNVPFVEGAPHYVLDFNGATNPLCNYSSHYNCPIPPRENVLSVAIRAGEMTYPKPH